MPAAASKEAGTCAGDLDVCKVPAPPGPPVPTPFRSTAMLANATKVSTKVLCRNKELVVETSEIPSCLGDQPGSAGGVVSGTVGDKVTFKLGSTKVLAEGKGVVYQMAMAAVNGANANFPVGMHDTPSQAVVDILP